MQSSGHSKPSENGFFNTLAQSATSNFGDTPVVLIGKGSEINDIRSANGRTKRKIITNSMILALVDIAKEEGNFEAVKQYWNTYHCQNSIISSDGKVYGAYCKNRICTVCSANRKADIINRYLPVLKTWDDAQFVTITIKSCSAKRLNYYIDGMLRTFGKINRRQNKRHERGTGIKLVGIRSLECNFNPKKKTYNPHFHIIVQTKEMADIIVDEWLKEVNKSKTKHANHKAQKIIPITNHEKALIEVIKYGSKIFTEPDLKMTRTGNEKIYAKALHNILQAMKGRRIFDRVGFDLPKLKESDKPDIKLAAVYERWTFEADRGNWINNKTKEPLTSYVAPFDLLELLAFHVDKDSS